MTTLERSTGRTGACVTLEIAMARGRQNNFDLIRLCAALAVVISHAWPLALGPSAWEPLDGSAPVSLGGTAALVFFFVSGLLVTRSAHRADRDLAGFSIARAGRIFPGLAVALGVTGLAFAAFNDLGYDPSAAAEYMLRGVTLAAPQHEIPGLFAANPYPHAANGPLWTLFYEVACYTALATAVWSGLLRSRAGWIIAALVVCLNWGWFQISGAPAGGLAYRLATGAPLACAFLSGAMAWRMREILPLDWRIGAGLAFAAAIAGPADLALPLYVAALGYLSLLIAYRIRPVRLGGDISYGIYIYGWPVSQAIVAITGSLAVLPVALASWLWIERPTLAIVTRRSTLALAAERAGG